MQTIAIYFPFFPIYYYTAAHNAPQEKCTKKVGYKHSELLIFNKCENVY